MRKLSFLLLLSLILLVTGCGKKINITDTGFEYDVKICDKYFELVECIIDKDTNEKYTKEIRTELKSEIKQMQEEWKQLNEEDLTKKCTEELSKLEPMKENMNSFGCSIK